MFLLKLLVLTFVLAIAGGIAYVAVTDAPVKQTEITKTIDPQGVLNDQ